MRFSLFWGLAACVAAPFLAQADEIRLPQRLVLGIPVVSQLEDLACPHEYRLEVVEANLIRGGWQPRGSSTAGPFVRGSPTLLTPWQRGAAQIWVRHGGPVCVIIGTLK
jgi:hypothetical protein